MTTREPEDLRRTQRRGRIVIVTMIVGFLAVCAVLGIFLWQREQEETRLAELTAPGLRSMGVPELPQEIHDVTALDSNRGLVATYVDGDGAAVPELRLLNLRVGADPGLCELLGTVEPDLADGCTTSGDHLSASANGPETLLFAEGVVRDSTLVVLVAHPATYSDERLRTFVDTAELMSVRDLAASID